VKATPQFDVVSIFPAMVEQALRAGVLGRAIDRGLLGVRVRDLRDFTSDRHRVVDDVPYGGGPGMVLKPEPIFRALDAIAVEAAGHPHVILTSPQGTPFTQEIARRLSGTAHLVLLCGRYEGVDERVRLRVDEEISIGDFVLTGGELAALVIVDAVARLIPGVVGDEQSVDEESFSRGLLDFPHYTRPAQLSWSGAEPAALKVPDVLVSGNHAEIRRWRKRAAVAQTFARRPDLLKTAVLDDEQRHMLDELSAPRRADE
jgi:tRNA (guanine37-N1)-methyltransferase